MADAETIRAGTAAETLLALLKPRLLKLERRAISQMIEHLRADTLTPTVMYSGIATLGALADLELELTREMRLGRADEAQLRSHTL